ncbi:conserved hypothetical protein [Microsporum canis CBS 113480]|uniref:Uncharacterized protein n=1 Tax=Arthroderma otae (strain ATCC MYA-4605 / CBS 113480) TaxID=554155 RepID=C5FRV6_ARTOC|nr:conserved hypothetical protein [Microsporum canis CBS 113480]EEQ32609.1 conserved hypothetical protein [Microsporum canis CBS 113480]
MNNKTQTMDNEYGISNIEDLERRMFIIATSSFSLIASFVSFALILFDNWKISNGDRPVDGDNCKTSAQVVWTISWINAYMLLALCLTFILRGVIPSKNFPKGIWLALSCGCGIFLLLILTWIPSAAKPNTSSKCSAEPSQWLKGWADIATGLTISPLPFFVTALRHHPSQASGLVSSISIHIFGFANSALFLILRGPRDVLSVSSDGQVWDKRSTWSSFGGADSGIVEVYRPERVEKKTNSIPLKKTIPKERHASIPKTGLGLSRTLKLNNGEYLPRKDSKTDSVGQPPSHRIATSETRGSFMKEALVMPSNASYHSNDITPATYGSETVMPQTPRLAFNTPVHHSPMFSPAVAPTELYPLSYGTYPMNLRLNVSTPALLGPNSSHKPLNMPSTPTLNRSGSLRRSLDSALLKPPYPNSRNNLHYHSNEAYKFENTPTYPAPPGQVYLQQYVASPKPSTSTYASSTPRRMADKMLPPIPPQDPQQVLFEAAMRLRDSKTSASAYSAQWHQNGHLSPLPPTYQSSPWI